MRIVGVSARILRSGELGRFVDPSIHTGDESVRERTT